MITIDIIAALTTEALIPDNIENKTINRIVKKFDTFLPNIFSNANLHSINMYATLDPETASKCDMPLSLKLFFTSSETYEVSPIIIPSSMPTYSFGSNIKKEFSILLFIQYIKSNFGKSIIAISFTNIIP